MRIGRRRPPAGSLGGAADHEAESSEDHRRTEQDAGVHHQVAGEEHDVDDPATRAEAGLATARLAICALRIEDANRLFVHRCRAVGGPRVAHAFDRSLAAVLRSLEPAYVIDSKGAADRRIADLIESEAGVAIVAAPRIDDAADAAAGDAAGATDGGATDGGAAAGPGPAPDVRSPGSGACSP